MPPDDGPRSAHWLADGFAGRLARMARERGAAAASIDALRDAAYAISRATTDGHVCVPLAEIERAAEDAGDLRALLLASDLVAPPSGPANRPLVLDDDDRLYLQRYFDYERRLAKRLVARASAPTEAPPTGLRAQLDALFAGNEARLGGRVDWQKVAVALAMMRKLTIVSGGPGTGKTTTVVNLLACLLAQDPDCRIALAAPTGKAAARMLDAIRARSGQLPADVTARFPVKSFTIHRLLGVSSGGDSFRHHAGNPLAIDVLVVDEASMLDLALATRLLEAVPDSARVILLGDKDQLASVEAGAVFAELSADPTLSDAMRPSLAAATGMPAERIVSPMPVHKTPLRDCVVWFTENLRFGADSGIGRLATMVNAGDGTVEWLRSRVDSSVTWIEDDARTPSRATMARVQQGYRPYLEAVRAGAEPAALFEAFNRFRVLCAERQSPWGVAGVNEAIARWFRAELDHPRDAGVRATWYPGRPVMVLRNDYVLGVFNGDIAIVLPNADGDLMAYLPQSDGGVRAIGPGRLPEHDDAFASTVHKAQGSEFDEVLLMLPPRASRVVARELLYTGVTRARERLVIVSSEEMLRQGATAGVRRDSGINARMSELAGD
jgi:exodeoxyribonuclease V alpha subunit